MLRLRSKDFLITAAAALMALSSLVTSVLLSHGLQSRILHVQETTALRRQFFLLADSLRKAEAAQRLYVITGNPVHESPVEAVEATIPERWSALRKAAGNQPRPPQILETINVLEEEVATAMGQLRETMSIRRTQGRKAAMAVVETGVTHAKLASVHEQLGVVMEQLEEQLQEQSREMMRAERLGHTGAVGAGGVAMLLAALGIWQWRRSLGHRQRELELSAEKSRAEQMARDKGDFLAAMSHEVRTPLNAVLGLSETLRESLPAGVSRQQADAVHGAARSLLRLVNDLLDLSRMDAGRLQLASDSLSIRGFTESLETLLAPQAAAAGISLSLSADPSLPEAILGDEGRLRQIVLNLASNALKFTERGGTVRIRLEREREAAGEMLVLEVKDNGCGIPGSLQRAIFQPYVQGLKPSTTLEAGTGLGLAIVQQLVRLMQGSVGLQSQPGAGSTFRVTLPLVSASHAGTSMPPAPVMADAPGPAAPCAAVEIEPLTPDAALRLRSILQVEYASALATQSSSDVLALADALEALDRQENHETLRTAAADLRLAGDSFAISSLSRVLADLPARFFPLLPSS